MRTWITDRRRLLGPVLIGCGLLLIPWLLYLSVKLPNTTRARNWSLMWTGVDVAEAIGLILTGFLQWRRTPRRALPAAFTAALLAIDAWVDVTTSAPGHAKVMSMLMAGLVEVPAAVACVVLAVAAFPTAAFPTAAFPTAAFPTAAFPTEHRTGSPGPNGWPDQPGHGAPLPEPRKSTSSESARNAADSPPPAGPEKLILAGDGRSGRQQRS